MAFFTETDARQAFRRTYGARTASAAVLDVTRSAGRQDFDVFLSHSSKDAELILGARALIEANGLSVYVDWIDDPQLNRTAVTPATAQHLKRRMGQCRRLYFATSRNSPRSAWMPWELGYFDALRGGKVAIFPLAGPQDTFPGQEYLGLYPTVNRADGVTPRAHLATRAGSRAAL